MEMELESYKSKAPYERDKVRGDGIELSPSDDMFNDDDISYDVEGGDGEAVVDEGRRMSAFPSFKVGLAASVKSKTPGSNTISPTPLDKRSSQKRSLNKVRGTSIEENEVGVTIEGDKESFVLENVVNPIGYQVIIIPSPPSLTPLTNCTYCTVRKVEKCKVD